MGNVAASGGYYISQYADCVLVSPGTITGSIGVITGKCVSRATLSSFSPAGSLLDICSVGAV